MVNTDPADAAQVPHVEIQRWEKGWQAATSSVEAQQDSFKAAAFATYSELVSHCENHKVGASLKLLYGADPVGSSEYNRLDAILDKDCPLEAQVTVTNLSKSFPLNQ